MNDLISVDINLPSNKFVEDEKQWGDVVSSASYLPRVQLYGANSDLVKESVMKMGNYGLVVSKNTIEDLGNQFDCLPISWRYKGMRINGDVIKSTYNPQSEEFKAIMVDAEKPDSGSMFGELNAA